MSTTIFVNLPADDLKKAREFYTKLGFTVKEEYSNEMALSVLYDGLGFMLVSPDFFKEITERDVPDTKKTSEVVSALSLDSRAAVDKIFNAAKEAGAPWVREPKAEDGMYAASFQDPFGHQFAIHAMD